MFAKKNPILLRTVCIVLSAPFIFTGCAEKSEPQQGPMEVGVYTAVAQPTTITTVLSGRTAAYAVAEVRPQISGIILKRAFVEGANVKAGQSLYQIDSATYRASYESAKAALAGAQAAALTAKLKAERYKALVTSQAVSKQDYDDAVATMKQSAADVLASKAAVEAANINVTYTKVNAPISGRIGRSSVTQGALVTTDQSVAMATIQQLDPIYVDVSQSSAEYLRLRQDLRNGRLQQVGNASTKVKLTLEDGSVYPLEGTLQFTDINVDSSTSAVTMRAVFPNPDMLLLPGVFVRATLEEGVNERAVLLPQQGVMRDQKGEPYSFIVGNDNKIAMRQLVIDKAVGNQWLVLSGIQPGDKVVIEGVQKVQLGGVVKAIELNKKAAMPGIAVSQLASRPTKPANTSANGLSKPVKSAVTIDQHHGVASQVRTK